MRRPESADEEASEEGGPLGRLLGVLAGIQTLTFGLKDGDVVRELLVPVVGEAGRPTFRVALDMDNLGRSQAAH